MAPGLSPMFRKKLWNKKEHESILEEESEGNESMIERMEGKKLSSYSTHYQGTGNMPILDRMEERKKQ